MSTQDAAKKESQPKKKNKVVDKMVTDGTIELKKDIAALSKEEQMEVLMRYVFHGSCWIPCLHVYELKLKITQFGF